MPLRVRLALAAAVAAVVVLGPSGWLFARSFESGLRSTVDESLRAQTVALVRRAESVGASIELDDPRTAAVATHDVVAQVLDASGRVVSATREAGSEPVISNADFARARQRSHYVDVRIADEHEHFRILAAPVEIGGGQGVALVGASLEATDESVARLQRGLLIGGAAAVALSAVGAWLLAAAALRPVERMRRQAAAISTHDLDAHLDVPAGRDELTALARTVNDLLARLRAALAREQTLVADASHELRTPLAVLRAELELATHEGRAPNELRDAVTSALARTDELTRLVDAMLVLAQTGDVSGLHRRDVGLRPLATEAADRLHGLGDRPPVVLDVPPELHAPVDPELFGRALDNLLQNACRFAPPGSVVTVRGRRDGANVSIAVLDEGPGFPAELLAHAFERFRRADGARGRTGDGAGLGLAIVEAIARAHGGAVRAENRVPRGAVVTIVVPGPVAVGHGATGSTM